jgi:hypothetical protein
MRNQVNVHGTDTVDGMIRMNTNERNADSTVLSFGISNHVYSDPSKRLSFQPITDPSKGLRDAADNERKEGRNNAQFEPI